MLEQLDPTFRILADVQLSGLLEKALPKPTPKPPNLWATEIGNPKQAFYERMDVTAEIPDELQRRFDFGNVMHAKFARCASHIDGCHASEAKLDGAYTGVPGIVGKVDLRMGDHLIEFKTSPYDVATPEDVWRLVPQYVAQLLVYAATWAKESREHLLIVLPVVDGKELPLRVFLVRVKDMNLLRQNVAKVRDLLYDALKNGNPGKLGNCAYYDNLCPFQKAGACDCKAGAPLIRGWLSNGIEIMRRQDLEATFQKAWTDVPPRNALHPWELVVPRRHYALVVHGHDHFAGEGNAKPDRAKARSIVRRAIWEASLAPPVGDLLALENPTLPAPSIGFQWVKIPKTVGKESSYRVAPAVIREWLEQEEPTAKKIVWSARQVAAVCGFHRLNEGYVVLWTPNLTPKLRTFTVSMKNLGAARDLVVRAIDELRKAIDAERDDFLPSCPGFTRNGCTVPACSC